MMKKLITSIIIFISTIFSMQTMQAMEYQQNIPSLAILCSKKTPLQKIYEYLNSDIEKFLFFPPDVKSEFKNKFLNIKYSDDTPSLHSWLIPTDPSSSITLTGPTKWYKRAAWSFDNKYIVTTSYDSTAKIWDTQTGNCIQTLAGHTDWVLSAEWSFDSDPRTA